MNYTTNSGVGDWFEQRRVVVKEGLSTALEEDTINKDVIELMLELLQSAKVKHSMVNFYNKKQGE